MDECQFSSTVLAKFEYSQLKTNVTIDKAKTKMPVVRIIMGISEQRGIEVERFIDRPAGQHNFGDFLRQIDNHVSKPAYIFMDNASWHTCSATR